MKLNHTQETREAQVRLLYEQLPYALLATILNALILTAVLWRQVSGSLLVGWLLAIVLVTGSRYASGRAYLRTPSANAESRRWGRHYLYGVASNGVLWGFGGFFFFTANSYVHQVFLAYVLMGMVSGAISTLAPVRGAYLVFLIPALFPYAARLLSAGSEVHLAMASMLFIYVTMMGMISHRLHTTVAESLRLRFDNLDLLHDLTKAKDRVERANEELAAQVAEKHSAQDALQKAYEELERRVKERTAELAKSEEALRIADRRKDEFLAMLSHELRNPLAPIRNALQLMHRPNVPDSLVKRSRFSHPPFTTPTIAPHTSAMSTALGMSLVICFSRVLSKNPIAGAKISASNARLRSSSVTVIRWSSRPRTKRPEPCRARCGRWSPTWSRA